MIIARTYWRYSAWSSNPLGVLGLFLLAVMSVGLFILLMAEIFQNLPGRLSLTRKSNWTRYVLSTLFFVTTAVAISLFLATRKMWHRYDFEQVFDGGVVEISTDVGETWLDSGPRMIPNPYDGIIQSPFSEIPWLRERFLVVLVQEAPCDRVVMNLNL